MTPWSIKPAFFCRFITTLISDRPRPQLFSSAVCWAAVTFSHNFWNGFDRDAFLDGSMIFTPNFHGISMDFPKFLPVSVMLIHQKNSPKSVPMVSPKMTDQPEGNHEKTSKGGLVQKSRTPKNPIRKHTNTHTKSQKHQVSSSRASDTSWDSSASWVPADPLWSGASSVSTSDGASELGRGWTHARRSPSKRLCMPPVLRGIHGISEICQWWLIYLGQI